MGTWQHSEVELLGYVIQIPHQLKVILIIFSFIFRVISIKNYHPKIRIITQMLQYHNKVMWWPTVSVHRIFLLCCIHSYPIFLAPPTVSIFLSKQKHPNKPWHVVPLQSNSVLFIYARNLVKILMFINCLGSNSQSCSVHSCYWFQMSF